MIGQYDSNLPPQLATDSSFNNETEGYSNMKSLYKLDSKKKLRAWNIWTEGDKIIQTAGLVGGKLVKNEKIAKPKNVGRSNETTPEEQADLEMNSTYNSKLTEGYFKTIEEAVKEEVILPMLAKSYGDHCKKIDWSTAFVQPKLDGMRCLCIIKDGTITLISRDGKIIDSTIMKHIVDQLLNIKTNIVLDGELYCHGVGFQENMRLIKKYRPGETEEISYCVYDLISDASFEDRSELVFALLSSCDHIETVYTQKISSEEELKGYHQKFLGEGYEGSILRWSNNGYKINGRSEHLLKYKDFQDMSLPIIDVRPSEQRPKWGQFVFSLKGQEFSCGMKFSHDERKQILINKKDYIGKTAELRYFELSEDGIPRFPICVGIRLDK